MPQLPTTKLSTKKELRQRRHRRVRGSMSGTPERPRLVISKSNRFVSAQVIDDVAGHTLAASHGRAIKGAQSAQAAGVGKEIAVLAKKAGVTTVVFDRAGYSYTGLIKTLADAAREEGLVF
jgi:large subunit ribosomal protein L18